jgi:hypothetical protein
MATNNSVPPPPRPDRVSKDEPDATRWRASPRAFYKRVAKRPDVREILKRLAQ